MRRKLTSLILAFVLVFSICFFQIPMASDNIVEASTGYNKSYVLKINRNTNVITAYKKGTNGEYNLAVKAMTCSVGVDGATPLGTYYTSQKLAWHVLMGPSYGQYCTRITGSILFHSVWYYVNGDKSSQSTVQYNKLGTAASHGCVRLTVADAKWIYDNCELGTRVVIFDGTSANDPLGKPETIKVSTASRTGWDPTDPDPANPHLKTSSVKPPTISCSSTKTVNINKSFNSKSGVTAKDYTGKDITSSIKVSGEVDTTKAGKYTITYTVKDSYGNTTSKNVIVTVVDNRKPTITGAKNQKVEYGSVINLKKGVKAVSADGKKLTSKIVITGEVDTSKLGKYEVTYSVTSANNVTKSKTVTITVVNTKKPIITGIKNLEYDITNTKNIENKIQKVINSIKAENVMGIDLTDSIKMTGKYNANKVGEYTLKFKVKDPSNNKTAKEIMTISIKDTVVPTISNVVDRTIEYNKKLTNKQKEKLIKENALENVILEDNNEILSVNKIKLTIMNLLDDEYSVNYYYEDLGGNIAQQQAIFTLKYVEATTEESTTEIEATTEESTTEIEATTEESTTEIEVTTEESTTEIEATTEESTTESDTTTEESTTEIEATTEESTAEV